MVEDKKSSDFFQYPKIQTLFKREAKGKKYPIIEGDWSLAEFPLISKWYVTEKLDGTNTRIIIKRNREILIKGRKKASQWHPEVLAFLKDEIVPKLSDPLFVEPKPSYIVVFGETVGYKIQGSKYFKEKNAFYVFDVANVYDDKAIWSDAPTVSEFCKDFSLNYVPELGFMNTNEVIELVKKGFKSKVNNKEIAEGVVLKTIPNLYDSQGNRIISKLKHKDFERDKE